MWHLWIILMNLNLAAEIVPKIMADKMKLSQLLAQYWVNL